MNGSITYPNLLCNVFFCFSDEMKNRMVGDPVQPKNEKRLPMTSQ